MSGLNMCPTTEHVAGKVSNLLQRPAEEYVNDSEIEMKWATKAFHMAETHYKLITSIRPSLLKLTKHDDEIYKEFRRDFPDLDLKKLPEDDMKTAEGKAKWRPFMNHFQGQVADYNQGCLIHREVHTIGQKFLQKFRGIKEESEGAVNLGQETSEYLPLNVYGFRMIG